MLSCCYAERREQAHYAECRYAECRYAEFRYAKCRYAECRYAECCSDLFDTFHFATFNLLPQFMKDRERTLTLVSIKIISKVMKSVT